MSGLRPTPNAAYYADYGISCSHPHKNTIRSTRPAPGTICPTCEFQVPNAEAANKTNEREEASEVDRSDEEVLRKASVNLRNNVSRTIAKLHRTIPALDECISAIEKPLHALLAKIEETRLLSLGDVPDVTIPNGVKPWVESGTSTVSTTVAIEELLDAILPDVESTTDTDVECHRSTTPSMYIDAQCDSNGKIYILQLFSSIRNHVYLIDVCTLGTVAFTTASSTGATFKDVLESSRICKGIFDLRETSNALFAQYKIRLSDIADVQLMAMASNGKDKKHQAIDLPLCVSRFTPAGGFTAATIKKWQETKKEGLQIFIYDSAMAYKIRAGAERNEKPDPDEVLDEDDSTAEEWTGRINKRPLLVLLHDYCVQDVAVLGLLHKLFAEDLAVMEDGELWRVRIAEETKKRLEMSQEEDYDGEQSCWGVEEWNGL